VQFITARSIGIVLRMKRRHALHVVCASIVLSACRNGSHGKLAPDEPVDAKFHGCTA